MQSRDVVDDLDLRSIYFLNVGCVCVVREFMRRKAHYKTDAERRGYSWVLFSHVPKMADVHDHRVVGHRDGALWRAVRNATWFQVKIE